ncbi:MAG: energy transducer TonB [Rhodocyclaceae bacterium]|nr:MAG: energy transducer TonB [Rhodocyclaceae bacterium]
MTLPTTLAQSSPIRALIVSLGLHCLLLWPVLLLVSPGSTPATDGRRAEVRARLMPLPPPQPVERSVPMIPTSGRAVPVTGPGAPIRPQMAGAADGMTVATTDARQPSPARAAEGLDAEGLRSYRMALAVHARRYRQYPEAAVQAGLRGTAEIRLWVLPGGGVTVSLERSSGHDALDEAALGMVRQATLAASLPDSLQGRQFALLIPLRFDPD